MTDEIVNFRMSSLMMLVIVCFALLPTVPVYGQTVPTRAPNFGNLPCNICPNSNDVITNPDAIIPVGTLPIPSITTDITCSELSTASLDAQFRPPDCQYIVQNSTIPTICGCSDGVTVPTPSSPVTTSTAVPTLQFPTSAPNSTTTTVAPIITQSPTATIPNSISPTTPTSEPILVSTVSFIEIQLANVPSILNTPELQSSFQGTVASFLQDSIPTDIVSSVLVQIKNQTFLPELTSSATSATTSSYPLNVSAEINGLVFSNTTNQSVVATLWTIEILRAFDTNSSTLISSLRATDEQFYGSLISITASERSLVPPTPTPPVVPIPTPTVVQEPTTAPAITPESVPVVAPTPTVSNDGGGISGGAIAGIIIVVLVVAGGFCFVVMRNKTEVDEETPVSPPPSSSSSSVPTRTSSKPSMAQSQPSVAVPQSKSTISTEGMITKTIVAPPGKLGIVIETTPTGPIVHEIKESSPLINQVSIGDVIVDIDSTDTRTMTSNAITKLMIDTAQSERRITVLTKAPLSKAIAPNVTAVQVEEVSVEGMKEKTIIAPPGKLGLVIDTTTNGPKIYKIREGSPLEGKVVVGDIIISIDGTDTSSMTAPAITTLMKDTSTKEREIVLLSHSPIEVTDEVSQQAPPEPEPTVTAVQVGDEAVVAAVVGMKQKTIITPAGKLGIVIDTTANGPMIQQLRDGSPLEGKVGVGDIIISIDGTDTSSMTAPVITTLMKESSFRERKMVLLSHSLGEITEDVPQQATPEIEPTNVSQVQVEDGAVATSTGNMKEKTIVAPAGKLGIVIDTTTNGPTINQLRDDSPLEDAVVAGDIIISVDGTDTRHMTASAVSSLMRETSFKERKIVLLSHSPIVLGEVTTDSAQEATHETEAEPEIVVSSSTAAEVEPDIPVSTSSPPPTAEAVAATVAASAAVVAAAAALDATTEEVSSQQSPLVPPGMSKKTITAPAGKLGIVVDTTPDGPRIQKINEGSPMKGIIEAGDIIASINGIDALPMRATEVANLMKDTSSKERTMVIFIHSPVVLGETVNDKEVVADRVLPAPEPNVSETTTITSEPAVASISDTQSEIIAPEPAIVPPPPASSATNPGTAAVTTSAASALNPPQSSVGMTEGMIVKSIIAPPGKLGIIIDTKLEGPVVFKIKEGSPLIGKVNVGDIITDIDGTDTRAMSASAITALMIKTAKSERKITLLSKDGKSK